MKKIGKLIVLLILALSMISIPLANLLGFHVEKLTHRILYFIYTVMILAIVAAISWITSGLVARARYKKDTDTEILEFVPEIPKISKKIHPLAKDIGRKLKLIA